MESMVVTKFEFVTQPYDMQQEGSFHICFHRAAVVFPQDWYEFDDVQVNPVMPEQAVA